MERRKEGKSKERKSEKNKPPFLQTCKPGQSNDDSA